jgi:hypothetical protein
VNNKNPPKIPGTLTTEAATHSEAPARRELSLTETNRAKKLGSDPYNSSSAKPATASKRALDDMRRLSEDIRTASTWVAPRRNVASELSLRVASLRVELERVLTELERLASGSVDPSDLQAADQRRQLRDAARYLEDAIDRLVPLEDQREGRD